MAKAETKTKLQPSIDSVVGPGGSDWVLENDVGAQCLTHGIRRIDRLWRRAR